ncbi:unnamed protein product [Calypogeia fissa]
MGDQMNFDRVVTLLEGLTKEIGFQKLQISTLVKVVEDQKKEIHALRNELNDSCKALKVIAKHTTGLEEKLQQDNTILLMEEKLRTYAEAAKQSHMEFLQAKEEEKRLLEEEQRNQQARANNCKLSGLVEMEKENTKEVVTHFFQTQLKVHETIILQAYRIGQKKNDLPRPILIKFGAQSEKARIMANRSMLKGERIWLDDDLTPTQVQARKIQLEKVKAARDQGWVAYLQNGQAVITNKKKDGSK